MNPDQQARIPPSAPEIEQRLIASMVWLPEICDQAVNHLQDEDFYDPFWRTCFQVITRLVVTGHQPDYTALEHEMKQLGQETGRMVDILEDAGGDTEYMIRVIRDQARRRRLILNYSKAISMAYDPAVDTADLMDFAQQKTFDMDSDTAPTEKTMAEIMKASVDTLSELRSGAPIGFKTGLDMDKMLLGFQRGNFYIIAARPSMGKTALALQIGLAITPQYTPAILSLETTAKSLGMRMISSRATVGAHAMRSGEMNDDEFESIKKTALKLSRLPVIIDDNARVRSESLFAKIRYMKQKYKIDMLIIDYVQLMMSDRTVREQQVAEVSRACVAGAKAFDIPIIGLAQLSREVERRTNKRPQLSDLRESGQLEQDAFAVILLYRPEYYGITLDEDNRPTDGVCEVIIAKHKDGPVGSVRQLFNKEHMRFENLTPF